MAKTSKNAHRTTAEGQEHILGAHTLHQPHEGVTQVAEDGAQLQLVEEELLARKERVQAGEVEIRKDVVSEQRSMDVPVTREEVVIERHAVDRRPADQPIGRGGEVIAVSLTEERVTLEKQTVVAEELEVGTQAVQASQRVSGTVRKEVVDVDVEGDVLTERGRQAR